MDLAHVPAARWVLALGRFEAGLLGLGAGGAALFAVLSWSARALLVAAVLAGGAAGWTLLVRAFAAHRPGAWWAQVVLCGAGLSSAVAGLAGGVEAPGLLSTALTAVTLALLLHPDSRDWAGIGRQGAGTPGLHHDHRRPHASTEEPA